MLRPSQLWVTFPQPVVGANRPPRLWHWFAALVEFQRNFARQDPGAVMDGRDIGTVVCPDADVKLYVTASPEVRAKRRQAELRGTDYDAVLAEIKARDARDSQRAAAPLAAAPDAVVIDTSSLSVSEVVAQAVDLIARKTGH